MPSRRASLPSLDGTIGLPLCSYLLYISRKVGYVQARMLFQWPPICHSSTDGALWVSQVPGKSYRTFALLIDPGRAGYATAISAHRFCPRSSEYEGRNCIQYFEADSHGFSTLCLRFRLRLSLHRQDSIPAGGSPYRVGFEPTGLLQLISSAALSPPIPKLQAYSWRHTAPCFLLSSLHSLLCLSR